MLQGPRLTSTSKRVRWSISQKRTTCSPPWSPISMQAKSAALMHRLSGKLQGSRWTTPLCWPWSWRTWTNQVLHKTGIELGPGLAPTPTQELSEGAKNLLAAIQELGTQFQKWTQIWHCHTFHQSITYPCITTTFMVPNNKLPVTLEIRPH